MQIPSPFPFFTTITGSPINLGWVYIGVADQDPETHPQQVYWDSALTIPATQPLRTDGGYIVNVGNPAAVYTAGAFSIRIRMNSGGSPGSQVFYRTHGESLADIAIAAMQTDINSLKYAPVTDNFITNIDGGIIDRMGDRVFVGGANKNDGNYPNDNPANQDWYTAYERAQGRSNGIIVSSQFAVLTNDYTGAAVSGVFAARTSNLGAGAGGAVGLEAHVVNDNATTPHGAWALYSEATRDSDAVGPIITYEADARNKGSYHAVTPYLQDAKQSVVLQVASGGGLSAVGVTDVSAGINFRDNPTKFGAGIVFGANAIQGTDGATGIGNAILSARGHQFAWVNSAGAQVGFILGNAALPANKTGITFGDVGLAVTGPSDTLVALFRPVTTAVNYLDFSGAVAGVAPLVAASGSDTNIDLSIAPKGTGLLRFATASSTVANGAVATVLGSLGPTGSHTTVQKWLSVKDSSGTQLYIPCF